MSAIRIAALAMAAAGLSAARPAAAQPGATPDRAIRSLDELIAAVPDEAMRARWRALAADDLAPLEALTAPRENPVPRHRERAPDDAPGTPQAAVQQAGEVRIVTDSAELSYRGPLQYRLFSAGRLLGRIPERGERVEIQYDLPAAQRVLQTAPVGQLQSTIITHVVNNAQREEVSLSDERGTVLLYVSQGSMVPYRREFTELPMRVRQLPPDETGLSPLRVTFGEEEFILHPGRSHDVTHQGARLRIWVGGTYFTEPERVPLAEGNAYHVRLLVFRRRD